MRDVTVNMPRWWTIALPLASACVWAAGLLVRHVPVASDGWRTVWTPMASAWASFAPLSPVPWIVVVCCAAGAAVITAGRLSVRPRFATAAVVASIFLSGLGSFELLWGHHATRSPWEEAFSTPLPTALDETSGHALAVRLASVQSEALAVLDTRAAGTAWEGAREANAFFAIARRLETLVPNAPDLPPPRVVPGWVLGPWAVSGIVSPWTLEAHVDGGLPAWARAVVAGHELAHLAGVVDEAEAEAFGLLAGLTSDDAAARYAAATWALASLPPRWADRASFPEQAKSDLEDLLASQSDARGWWVDVAWSTYDAWLRHRGQAGGTGGYARGAPALWSAHQRGAW